MPPPGPPLPPVVVIYPPHLAPDRNAQRAGHRCRHPATQFYHATKPPPRAGQPPEDERLGAHLRGGQRWARQGPTSGPAPAGGTPARPVGTSARKGKGGGGRETTGGDGVGGLVGWPASATSALVFAGAALNQPCSHTPPRRPGPAHRRTRSLAHRAARQGRNPGPGAALHPQVPWQDHGHQVRRQRHDRPGAAGRLCRGRGAAQAGGHEPGGGARRRAADRDGAEAGWARRASSSRACA